MLYTIDEGLIKYLLNGAFILSLAIHIIVLKSHSHKQNGYTVEYSLHNSLSHFGILPFSSS